MPKFRIGKMEDIHPKSFPLVPESLLPVGLGGTCPCPDLSQFLLGMLLYTLHYLSYTSLGNYYVLNLHLTHYMSTHKTDHIMVIFSSATSAESDTVTAWQTPPLTDLLQNREVLHQLRQVRLS